MIFKLNHVLVSSEKRYVPPQTKTQEGVPSWVLITTKVLIIRDTARKMLCPSCGHCTYWICTWNTWLRAAEKEGAKKKRIQRGCMPLGGPNPYARLTKQTILNTFYPLLSCQRLLGCKYLEVKAHRNKNSKGGCPRLLILKEKPLSFVFFIYANLAWK